MYRLTSSDSVGFHTFLTLFMITLKVEDCKSFLMATWIVISHGVAIQCPLFHDKLIKTLDCTCYFELVLLILEKGNGFHLKRNSKVWITFWPNKTITLSVNNAELLQSYLSYGVYFLGLFDRCNRLVNIVHLKNKVYCRLACNLEVARRKDLFYR